MTDYFALLGEERRPSLDPERIRATYHRLSREWHPDQQSGTGPARDFAALNTAQRTLTDPKSRVRHLLALEYPQISVSGPSAVPTALADLMFPLQALLAEANAFLGRKNATTHELSRALMAADGFFLQEKIEERLAGIEERLDTLLDELRRFDAERWDARPADAGTILLGFYHGFAYLGRWSGQLREQLFGLAV